MTTYPDPDTIEIYGWTFRRRSDGGVQIWGDVPEAVEGLFAEGDVGVDLGPDDWWNIVEIVGVGQGPSLPIEDDDPRVSGSAPHSYKPEGPKYVFRHGESVVLTMVTQDCGRPWEVVRSLDEGLSPERAACVERLITYANWACLILESWHEGLRKMSADQANPLGGYGPGLGLRAAIALRAVIDEAAPDD